MIDINSNTQVNQSCLILIRILLLAILQFISINCYSHALNFGQLKIVELDPYQYEIYFSYSSTTEKALHLNFPEDCTRGQQRQLRDGYISVFQFELNCKHSMLERSIEIERQSDNSPQIFVSLNRINGELISGIFKPEDTSFSLSDYAKPARNESTFTKSFIMLGIQHILSGLDHLLFLLLLLFLTPIGARLLGVITAFTIGHSMTLILVGLDLFSLDQTMVEVMIALSILLLAAEVGGSKYRFRRYKNNHVLIVVVFGLFHGLGFSGALEEVGLVDDDPLLSLLAFNFGIELGQLLFISIVLVIVKVFEGMFKHQADREHLNKFVTYCVGGFSGYWFFERLFLVW